MKSTLQFKLNQINIHTKIKIKANEKCKAILNLVTFSVKNGYNYNKSVLF